MSATKTEDGLGVALPARWRALSGGAPRCATECCARNVQAPPLCLLLPKATSPLLSCHSSRAVSGYSTLCDAVPPCVFSSAPVAVLEGVETLPRPARTDTIGDVPVAPWSQWVSVQCLPRMPPPVESAI